MKTERIGWYAALTGVLLLSSLAYPAHAQEQPPKTGGHIIIRGPEGVQEYDLDPDQLPPLGEGGLALVMKVGPDGQLLTLGNPNLPGDLNGINLSLIGPNGVPLIAPGMIGGLNIVDPGRSYLQLLVRRDDVRTELLLSQNQSDQIDAMDAQQQQAQKQQMTQMQEALKNLGNGLAGKSPEEIGNLVKEQMEKAHDAAQSLVDDRDKRLAAILNAKQMARLKELDLQWRGPLALGVKPVADQAKLTDAQFPKMVELLQEYRKEIRNQLGFGIHKANFTQQKGGNVSSGNASSSQSGDTPPADLPPPASPAEMQDRKEKALKEIDKARKSLAERALKGLTDAQRQQWNTLTGRRFKFRNND